MDAPFELPPPVARYLDLALPAGQEIRLARLEQTGTLRTDPSSDRWLAFDATEVVRPDRFRFEWVARVRVAPLVHLQVTDSLIAGRGSGEVRLGRWIPLGRARESAQMNEATLHRFLAEAVWYPSALRPSQHLRWTAIDDSRADAALTADGVSVSLEFRFGPDGEVTGIHTPARWGRFGARLRTAAWEGHFGELMEVDGLRVPRDGEVGWYVENTWRSVWKGRVRSARYEFAPLGARAPGSPARG